MKNLLIIIFLLIVFNPLAGYAQRLNLNELISFVKKDIVDINILLSGKNWTYVGSERDEDYVIATWGHTIDKYDSTAVAWVEVLTSPQYFNTITYQCPSPQIFNGIINGILDFNPRIGDAIRKDDGGIEKTYYGKNYWYKSRTISGTNIIIIYDAESQRNRNNEILKPYIINPDNPIKITLLYSTTLKEGLKQAVVYSDEGGLEPKGLVLSTDKLEIYNRGDDFYWISFKDGFAYINKKLLKAQ